MLERLLFERVETRIMVGITALVGIMLMVGWVAINETARMAAFERQFAARSIERGAELFASHCSTCHGVDGRGLVERAPGLNNPQFFGHDFLAEYDRQIAALDVEAAGLEAQRSALADEFVAEGTSQERKTEIETELETLTARLSASNEEGIPAQREALIAQREDAIGQMFDAIDRGYNPEEPSRAENLDWKSTLDSLIFTTLVHGRPTSKSYWDNPMPAWSQMAGGPLRDDQIQDLAHYILNWDKGEDWTMEDLLLVQQFAKEPGSSVAAVEIEAVGTDVAAILEKLEADGIVGDAANGEALYTGQVRAANGSRLSCSGCHLGGTSAPDTVGTWTRVQDERLNAPEFAGYTGEQYLVESIVLPNNYVVAGWSADVMTQTFGEQLDHQNIADLLAFLQTQE